MGATSFCTPEKLVKLPRYQMGDRRLTTGFGDVGTVGGVVIVRSVSYSLSCRSHLKKPPGNRRDSGGQPPAQGHPTQPRRASADLYNLARSPGDGGRTGKDNEWAAPETESTRIRHQRCRKPQSCTPGQTLGDAMGVSWYVRYDLPLPVIAGRTTGTGRRKRPGSPGCLSRRCPVRETYENRRRSVEPSGSRVGRETFEGPQRCFAPLSLSLVDLGL